MDAAMEIVERAHRERSFGVLLPELVVGWTFDPLRDEERFKEVLRDMKLDPEIGLRLRERDPYWQAAQR